jgi:putative nucleotidyltransferase with HDIG domain
MMNKTQAERLLQKHLKKYPGLISHSKQCAKFAKKVAKKINQKYLKLNLDVHKIEMAALLHDIGRDQKNTNDYLHFEIGYQILKNLGYKNLGKIIRTHADAARRAKYFGLKGNYKNKTIEQKIITYVDNHIGQNGFESDKERIRDILKRRGMNEFIKKVFLPYKRNESKKIDQEIEKLMGCSGKELQ